MSSVLIIWKFCLYHDNFLRINNNKLPASRLLQENAPLSNISVDCHFHGKKSQVSEPTESTSICLNCEISNMIASMWTTYIVCGHMQMINCWTFWNNWIFHQKNKADFSTLSFLAQTSQRHHINLLTKQNYFF